MTDRSLAQTLTMVFGATFLLVGILGFVPGITTNYDDLGFAGEDSTAELLGLFQVSVLHNIVHLLFGLAGLALARTLDGARAYLLGGGIIYAALWLLGLVGGADWVPANDADHWLHLVLALALLGSWFASRSEVGVRDRVRATT
jgi:hypothetical protein